MQTRLNLDPAVVREARALAAKAGQPIVENYVGRQVPTAMVARNLERIADHASNIATDVIFWIRGADVRHQLSMSMD